MNHSPGRAPAAEWLEQALEELRCLRSRNLLAPAIFDAAAVVLQGIEVDDLLKPEVWVADEVARGPLFLIITWRGPTGKVLQIHPCGDKKNPSARVTVYDAAGVYASFEGREFLNVIRGWLAIVFPDGKRVSEPEPGTWTGPVRGERTR